MGGVNSVEMSMLRQFNISMRDEVNALVDEALIDQRNNSSGSNTVVSDFIDLTIDYEEEVGCTNVECDAQRLTPDFEQGLLDDDAHVNTVGNNLYPAEISIQEETRNVTLVETVTEKEINALTLDNAERVQDNAVQTTVHLDNEITLRECFVNLNRLNDNNISRTHSNIIKKPNHIAESTDICNNNIKHFSLHEQLVKKNNIKSQCIIVLNRLSPVVQKKVTVDTSINAKRKNHLNEYTTVNKANGAILNKSHFQLRKCVVLLEKSSIIEAGNKYIQQSKNCMQISKKRNHHVAVKRLSNNIVELDMRVSIKERLYTCDKCPFHTLYKRTLTVHKNNHIGEKPFNDNMGVKYPLIDSEKKLSQSAIPVKRHVGNHMECNFPKPKSLPGNPKTPNSKKPFQCFVCKQAFSQCSSMRDHRKTHFKGEFTCQFCSFSSLYLCSLKRHIATCHKVVRNCPKCEFSTVHRHLFVKHNKTHCKYCEFSSSTKSNIVRHEKTHRKK